MRRLKRRKLKAVLANLVCSLAWLSLSALCILGSKLILFGLATVFILASVLFGALTIVSIKMKPEDYDDDTV